MCTPYQYKCVQAGKLLTSIHVCSLVNSLPVYKCVGWSTPYQYKCVQAGKLLTSIHVCRSRGTHMPSIQICKILQNHTNAMVVLWQNSVQCCKNVALMSTNCLLLPTKWCFCCISELQSENSCTDIKKTVNFHVTTVVNKESFLCKCTTTQEIFLVYICCRIIRI